MRVHQKFLYTSCVCLLCMLLAALQASLDSLHCVPNRRCVWTICTYTGHQVIVARAHCHFAIVQAHILPVTRPSLSHACCCRGDSKKPQAQPESWQRPQHISQPKTHWHLFEDQSDWSTGPLGRSAVSLSALTLQALSSSREAWAKVGGASCQGHETLNLLHRLQAGGG